MKKILLILVAIVALAAAWLGTAWYTGQRIEARAGEYIARLNTAWSDVAQPGMPLPQVRQVSFERGLLSSHARLAFDIGGVPPGYAPEVDLVFSHGPFPLAALRQGQLAPQQFHVHGELLATGMMKAMLDTLTGGKPPLVADYACSYGRHCTVTGSVPAIDFDMGRMAPNAKLSFGGMQLQGALDFRSETDYTSTASVQVLPLSIGGQDFGSGRMEVTSDAQSVNELITWKTGQGESKLTLAFAATRPIPMWGDPSLRLTPDKLPELIKSASFKVELSKPMAIDIAARALHLTRGVALADAQQEIGAEIDMALTLPDAEKFVRAQGDLLVSDWQYTGGQFTINGTDRPEILEQIKQAWVAGQPGGLK
jgi:uncharacterized protein YdgA (DUF945 family)